MKYKYTMLCFSLCFIGILFVGILFFKTLPFNPIRNLIDSKLISQTFNLVPQGWAFFTRNPREAQFQLYKKSMHKQNWEKVMHLHSHYTAYFGISRKYSGLLAELTGVRAKLNDKDFINCKGNYQRGLIGCVPDTAIIITNEFDNPTLCGEFLLTLQKPVPWAWSKSMNEILMPSKVIKINISCK